MNKDDTSFKTRLKETANKAKQAIKTTPMYKRIEAYCVKVNEPEPFETVLKRNNKHKVYAVFSRRFAFMSTLMMAWWMGSYLEACKSYDYKYDDEKRIMLENWCVATMAGLTSCGAWGHMYKRKSKENQQYLTYLLHDESMNKALDAELLRMALHPYFKDIKAAIPELKDKTLENLTEEEKTDLAESVRQYLLRHQYEAEEVIGTLKADKIPQDVIDLYTALFCTRTLSYQMAKDMNY